MAIEYLIAYTNDLNHQDLKGQTALHKVAINCNKYINTWIVKEMIRRGSSRIIKDNDGNTPLKYVGDNQVMRQIFVNPGMNKPGC